MPEETNKTPVPIDDAAARQKRIEDFLLDPDKAIFRTLEEFRTAIEPIVAALSGVNLNELEQIVGKDGVTPRRGVEYFNEEDIKAFEAFIISKIPKVGVELPSRVQIEDFVRELVAKIPRVKGDDGKSLKFSDLTPAQKEELRGKDGSSDSGTDIVKKLRALGKNQMLRIDDIRGLENILSRKVSDDVFDELKKRVDDMKIVIPANPGGGSSEGGGADETAIHYDGEDEFATIVEDATPAAGDYFLAERASDGVKIKVPYSALVGEGTGDMLAAVYDPNGVAGDAFDMENMVEGATKKILTAAERTKLGHISVTQAVDLDTIETDVAASKAKTDQISVTQAVNLDTIESDVAASKAKTDHISVTQAVDLDTMESKLAGIEALADVTDAGNVGSSIHGASAKTTPVDADTMPLIDSAASNVLKKVTWANIKATLKTYFDTLYQPLAAALTSWAAITRASGFDTFVATPSSANLRSLLTDETGTGAAVFGTSPNITTPTGIVKGDVGLGNVDNTSDATKNAATATLTNKRITPRIGTTASSSTPTPDADAHDQYNVTALAAGATFGAPSGTPTDGQRMIIRVKDNGTARTLAFNAIYRAVGITLPTTTVISKTLYLGMIYNSADTKWDVIAYVIEA